MIAGLAGHATHGRAPIAIDTERPTAEKQPVVTLDLGYARGMSRTQLLFGASQGGVHAADRV